ncbi:cytochrome c [Phenylobacterium sp.]|uniref:c-type cytochrome n=1 Tax=Phenylobacterium sp. TaxID=1871053 RepID=UPI00286DC346|nr:cytochrome c [Phenylobacterium sp.]
MSVHTLAVVTALAIAMGGCATLVGHKRADSPEQRGRTIAQRACSGCHAVEPGGQTRRGGKAPAFGSLEMRHTVGLEGRLAELTRTGHYDMPPVSLTAAEVSDLRAYIEGLHPR